MEDNTIRNGEDLMKYLNKVCDNTGVIHKYKVPYSKPRYIKCDFGRFECEEEDFWSYVEYIMENKED